MNDHVNRILARFLSGEVSLQEKEQLRKWLNDSQANRDEYTRIMLAYQLSKGDTSNRKEKVYKTTVEKIARSNVDDKKLRLIRKVKFGTWFGIAATFILIISILLVFIKNSNEDKSTEIVRNAEVIKFNPAGQKLKFRLPDGSLVWLNSESSLTYEEGFNDSMRILKLKGEAYFEVKRDVNRPFVVYCGSIATTALGTTFNIRAFNENDIMVSLITGKARVNVRNMKEGERSILLGIGEGVIYNPDDEMEIKKVIVGVESVVRWKDGLLELKDSSLEKTVIVLERWYGVDIQLKNNPNQPWNVNGLFDNEALDNVLNSLSFSLGFDYEIDGKKVYITFR